MIAALLLNLFLYIEAAEHTQKTVENSVFAGFSENSIVAENAPPNKTQEIDTEDVRQNLISVRPKSRTEKKTQKKPNQQSGYQGIIEENIGFTVTHIYTLQGSILKEERQIFVNTETLFTNGYRFNPVFFMGIGTGLQRQSDDSWSYSAIPLFANIRLYAPSPVHAPFIGTDIGYMFFPSKHIDGGFYLNVYLGLRIKLQGKMAVSIGGGYARQNAEGITASLFAIKGPFNAGKLKLGFEF